eukprot:jgi/Mesen1/386/ME000010S_10842
MNAGNVWTGEARECARTQPALGSLSARELKTPRTPQGRLQTGGRASTSTAAAAAATGGAGSLPLGQLSAQNPLSSFLLMPQLAPKKKPSTPKALPSPSGGPRTPSHHGGGTTPKPSAHAHASRVAVRSGGSGAAANILGLPFAELRKRYLVTPDELGRGRFGVIHVCIDRASGDRLACKTISKDKLRGGRA